MGIAALNLQKTLSPPPISVERSDTHRDGLWQTNKTRRQGNRLMGIAALKPTRPAILQKRCGCQPGGWRGLLVSRRSPGNAPA